MEQVRSIRPAAALIAAGIILLVIAAALCSGCTAPEIARPTITVDGIAVENVSLSALDLSVRLTVSNPNPVGATLDDVSFDLYFLDGGEQKFLAHGERDGFEIRPGGDTTVAIPVRVDNLRLVQTVLALFRDGAVTFRVSGSATVDFGVVAFEDTPFTREVEVTLPEGRQ
ncbi:MAG: LEA type 2 family protein [Methanomicrobiaceae archaeon]|nr:LEA type 2 family protein [Methanomicrobiaceae archaeon]